MSVAGAARHQLAPHAGRLALGVAAVQALVARVLADRARALAGHAPLQLEPLTLTVDERGCRRRGSHYLFLFIIFVLVLVLVLVLVIVVLVAAFVPC